MQDFEIEDDQDEDEDYGIVMERIVVDENLERRKAKEIVSAALMSASTPLENRGVKHRMLPGLWYGAVNVLIASIEIEDILRLFNDRIRGIVGTAENADAPPRAFGESAMKAYVEEVTLATETVMEALDEAHERMREQEIDDRFPETVLDTALRVLIPAWGPDHVRRAILEQSALFIQNSDEVSNFMEPSRILDPQAARRRQSELAQGPVAREAVPAAREKVADFEFKPRIVNDRRIRIFAGSDVLASGLGLWAVAMTIRDENGRYEFRKFGGRMDDPNGGRVTLAAVHEASLAVGALKGRSTVVIETVDEMVVRGIEAGQGGGPGSRREADRETWSEIDHVFNAHDVAPRLVTSTMADQLQESCDHLLRELAQV